MVRDIARKVVWIEGIANASSVAVVIDDVGTKRHVIWGKFVQILAGNQPVHRRAQVGEAHCAAPPDLTFEGRVVLMNAWLVNTEGNEVDCRSAG